MERTNVRNQLVQSARKVEGRPLVVWPIEDEKEARDVRTVADKLGIPMLF